MKAFKQGVLVLALLAVSCGGGGGGSGEVPLGAPTPHPAPAVVVPEVEAAPDTVVVPDTVMVPSIEVPPPPPEVLQSPEYRQFLLALASALDNLPVKELIHGAYQLNGKFCAIGLLAFERGLLDKNGYDIAALFQVHPELVYEVVNLNDQAPVDTDAERWVYVREWVKQRLG